MEIEKTWCSDNQVESIENSHRDERKWCVNQKEPSPKLKKLNQVIRGWVNYFLIGSMKGVLTEIDSRLRTRLRIIIWKMWKVPSKRQWGLQKLGINRDLARLTSYCGDRYYFVATKTCVSRAISKDILTRRGLVSPLDYYEHRRNVRFN